MDLITPAQWQNSPGINASGQAFVARWLELFHRLTIDTYRVRHSNARLAFQELCSVINDVERFRIEVANVTDVAHEAKRLLAEDPVADALLPQRQYYYHALTEPLLDNNKVVHPGLRILADQIRARFEKHYRNTLLDALHTAIVEDQLDATLTLTSALASDLISDGFDLRHLFWRGGSFLLPPARQFTERLDAFLTTFREPVKQDFTVVFRLTFASEAEASDLPATIGRMSIATGPPRTIHRAAAEYGKDNPLFRYAFVAIQALDPYAAAHLGTTELSRALDLLQFARPRTAVSFPSVSLVDWLANAMTIPTALELLGPMRIATEELEVRVRQVSDAGRDPRVARATHDRITAGLHYLRRGLTDSVATGQFTNLWVGLETIAGGTGRTNIPVLRHQISRLIALGYPRRVLSDLRANINRLHIGFVREFDTAVLSERRRTVALVALWKFVRSTDFVENVVRPAAIEPLLKRRLMFVSEGLANRESVRRNIERNAQDVSWHLQRMYRARNMIVHGGSTPGELTHLSSHLATYLWAVLRIVIEELAQPGGIADIEQVLAKYSWLYEEQTRMLRDQGEIQYEALVNPTILWPSA